MKRLFIAFLFTMIGTTAGQFSVAADPTPEANSPLHNSAVVTLDNQPLFRVRGMTGFPADQRAQSIATRIESVAADPEFSTSSLITVDQADHSEIMAGDVLLAAILNADATLENAPRALLAERARINILNAIQRYRRDRSAAVLLRRTAIAALATLALAGLLLLIRRALRRVIARCESALKSRIETLETRSSKIIKAAPVASAITGAVNIIGLTVTVAVVYIYLNFVLGLFPWTRPIAARLFSIFIEPFRILGSQFVAAIPDLAFLAILVILVRQLLKVVRLFFIGIDQGTISIKDFDRDWGLPTYRIVRLLVICLAVVVAYPYIPGASSDAFKGVSLFVGVLFSLGSTSFIANILASLALTYRRAFKVGDVIKVDNVMGLVTEMRLQACHLRNFYNEVIVIPNSVLVNSNVMNYSTLAKERHLTIRTQVGIGYETPWRQVDAMLKMAVERTPGLRKDHAPVVLQRSLDSFAVLYELLAYCDNPLAVPLLTTNLHQNVLDVFNEYGVQIMTPAYEGDPETPKIVSKDREFAMPAKTPNGSGQPMVN